MAKRGSEEWKNNIRVKRIGQFIGDKNPFWGKKHSEHSIIKNRKAHIGKRAWNKGLVMSDETRKRLSEALKGRKAWNKGLTKKDFRVEKYSSQIRNEKHYLWKGDNVGYKGLHGWINKKIGNPKKSDICGTVEEKIYEWHNIDKKYRRDFKDWKRVCRKCHRKEDKKL